MTSARQKGAPSRSPQSKKANDGQATVPGPRVLSGSEILIESLGREAVEYVFGIPGGVIIPLYDQYRSTPNLPFVPVLNRHEQGATHMADGYARATGKVGVCLVTSGPGATNTVTGLATAYMDSIPMVCITGQVPTALIGNDAFQEADIVGITRPVTKHNYLVKDVKDLARTLREAFYVAHTGRPGPVLVDVPKDVLLGTTEFLYPEKAHPRGYDPTVKGNPRQIRRAMQLIEESERPLLYTGGGILLANAHEELTAFADATGIPVLTTLLGLGGISGENPNWLGMPGMHGAVYCNYAFHHTDLIIAIGARFDDRVTGNLEKFAPYAKIIHVDIDPSCIGKNVRVDCPIVGDAKEVLAAMTPQAKRKDIQPWWDQIEAWKKEYPYSYAAQSHDGRVRSEYVVEQLYEATQGDAIITTEVGQHQMWAAQYFRYKHPRSFISSGGLGTMGFGFPAAIGAKFGRPDKTVIDIAGDGSLQMTMFEMPTAVDYDKPVVIANLNNGYLGMVRQWQEMFHGKRYSGVDLSSGPDFVRLAESYGAIGIRVTDEKEVRPAIDEALHTNKPVLLDIMVDREANVWPMVPPGAGLNETITGPTDPNAPDAKPADDTAGTLA